MTRKKNIKYKMKKEKMSPKKEKIFFLYLENDFLLYIILCVVCVCFEYILFIDKRDVRIGNFIRRRSCLLMGFY